MRKQRPVLEVQPNDNFMLCPWGGIFHVRGDKMQRVAEGGEVGPWIDAKPKEYREMKWPEVRTMLRPMGWRWVAVREPAPPKPLNALNGEDHPSVVAMRELSQVPARATQIMAICTDLGERISAVMTETDRIQEVQDEHTTTLNKIGKRLADMDQALTYLVDQINEMRQRNPPVVVGKPKPKPRRRRK